MERTTLATRGPRRKKTILVALTLGALTAGALLTPLLSEVEAAAPDRPSDDIRDYGLFASVSLNLKGGGPAQRSQIRANIGVGTPHAWNPFRTRVDRQGNPSATGTARLALCNGTDGRITLGESNYVVAPSVQLGETCEIPKAFGFVRNEGGWPPATEWVGWITPPSIRFPALPTLVPSTTGGVTQMRPPAAACTDPDERIAQRFTGGLQPNRIYSGDDRTFRFGDGIAQLGSGTYTFCNLSIDRGTLLITQPGTVINVVGNLSLSGGWFGGNENTTVNVWGTDVAFGRNGMVMVTVNAPNADVALGHSTNIVGRVWGRTLRSDRGVNVWAPRTTTPTSTVPTSTVPTSTVPTSTVPTSTVPTSTVPTSTVPTSTVPTSTVPTSTVPTSTVPPTTVPPTTVPPTTPTTVRT
jgi:hypothetical protein